MARVITTRERGTLQSTLPQSPRVFLSFFAIVCALLTTLVLENFKAANAQRQFMLSYLLACLGASAHIIGSIYSDPLVYGFFFGGSLWGILVYFTDEGIDANMAQSTLPFVVAMTISLVPIVSTHIFSLASSNLILNQFNVWAICFLSLYNVLTSMLKTIDNSSYHPSTINIPSFIINIATLFLYQVYFSRRSHKNGCLILDGKNGAHILITLSIGYCLTRCLNEDNVSFVMPYMMGSLIASFFAASIAFVADNWYIVGTGQFYMVALDTGGIFFYFVFPAIVVFVKFFQKYEDTVTDVVDFIGLQLKSGLGLGLNALGTNTNEFQVQHDLIVLIFIAISIGLPLIHNICPITGHLYGRVYTHGHPNTKKVSICVDFAELKSVMIKILKNFNDGEVLNIFVTFNDLEKDAKLIQELHKAGHNIGITVGNKRDASSILKKTFSLAEKIIGETPKWCCCKFHNCYEAAQQLEMKCALWSTVLDFSMTDALSIKNILAQDLVSHQGGNIIYCRTSCLDEADTCGKKAKMLLECFRCIKNLGFESNKLGDLIGDLNNQMNL